MRLALVGLGAVGLAAAQALSGDDGVDGLVVMQRGVSGGAALDDLRRTIKATELELRRGDGAGVGDLDGEIGAVILAYGEDVVVGVRAALARNIAVVVAADDPRQLRRVQSLDAEARERGVSVVLGATMAPGLSCVLVRHAAAGFDSVGEIHVASMGTGGPACARRHHRALSSVSVDWRDGGWARSPGGSGRELVWFPEPVGGADCYRAELADPFLLRPAFNGVRRITARLEATRRDRLTSRLPMLRPPHPEGTVGALRVDVRGTVGQRPTECLLGVAGRPAALAGMVAAEAARWAAAGRLARPGVGGLAEMVAAPGEFLRQLGRRGVRVERFEGNGDDAGADPGPGRPEIDTPAS